MEIRYNLTGVERKALVTAVSEITGRGAVYKGAPTFAYAVNDYTIDKNGALTFDERADMEEARRLLAALAERGFMTEDALGLDDGGPASLCVEVPLDGFTQTALDNLEKLVAGKAALIMLAVGAHALPIERAESTLRFPWFTLSGEEGEADAYTRFIHALCELAKKQRRVTMREADVDSEKFAFRCFLLRLGFIGKEYAPARKLLLRNLPGNGSFRSAKQAAGRGDCLSCGRSMSEPGEDGEPDRLFCPERNRYVDEDGSCGAFNRQGVAL